MSDNKFRVADLAGTDGVARPLSAFDSSRDCLRTFSRLRVRSEIRFLIAEVILLVVILVPSVRLSVVWQVLGEEFKLCQHFVGT